MITAATQAKNATSPQSVLRLFIWVSSSAGWW
jgi:hypothetical protein